MVNNSLLVGDHRAALKLKARAKSQLKAAVEYVSKFRLFLKFLDIPCNNFALQTHAHTIPPLL